MQEWNSVFHVFLRHCLESSFSILASTLWNWRQHAVKCIWYCLSLVHACWSRIHNFNIYVERNCDLGFEQCLRRMIVRIFINNIWHYGWQLSSNLCRIAIERHGFVLFVICIESSLLRAHKAVESRSCLALTYSFGPELWLGSISIARE